MRSIFYLYTGTSALEAVDLEVPETGDIGADVKALWERLRVEYPGRRVSYCRDARPATPLVRFA